jgi:glucokinase
MRRYCMSSENEKKPAEFATVDIGGTNWRVGPARGDPGDPGSAFDAARSGGHCRDLELLRQRLSAVFQGWRGSAVTVAVAGPVEGDVATLTNWPGQPRIVVRQKRNGQFDAVIDDEVEVPDRKGKVDQLTLTFPAENAQVVNDLEAAVYGLVEAFSEKIPKGLKCRTLLEGRTPSEKESESGSKDKSGRDRRLVLIMPGTGLGTAALVRTYDRAGNAVFTAVPSEMQHSQIPSLDEPHARLIERWKAKTGVHRLRWEDFVSGDGLVMVYHLLGGVEGLGGGDIGDRAGDEIDRASVEALDLYYRCVVRYAQLAALAYQPTDGVFLGGDTTLSNQEFICRREKEFRWDFYDIPSQVHLQKLEGVRIDLVLGELVLRGGHWMARRAAGRL